MKAREVSACSTRQGINQPVINTTATTFITIIVISTKVPCKDPIEEFFTEMLVFNRYSTHKQMSGHHIKGTPSTHKQIANFILRLSISLSIAHACPLPIHCACLSIAYPLRKPVLVVTT